jgi:hypothetical protein
MDGGRCSGLEEPCQEENARWKNCKVSQENGRCYQTKGVFTRCILGFSRIIWEDQRLWGEASAPCRAKRPQSSSASRLTGGRVCPGAFTRGHYEATGEAATAAEIRSALDLLEARAQFVGPERTVHIRTAEHSVS